MSRVTLAAQVFRHGDAYPSAVYGSDDMAATIGLAALLFTVAAVVTPSLGRVELRDAGCGSVALSDQQSEHIEMWDAVANSVTVSDA